MSDSALLLRMLEPAVRPGAIGKSAPPKPANQPFESRSFESLLSEARQTNAAEPARSTGRIEGVHVPRQDAEAGTGVAEATNKQDALGPLAGLGTVENATLRAIMADHAGPPAKGA